MNLAALLAACTVAAMGCGGDDDDGGTKSRTVDANKLEQEIEQNLSSKTVAVQSVSCPGDVKSDTGAKFTCSAKFEAGGSAKVAVTETEAPNEFSYEFKPGTVVLAGESVEEALKRDLEAQGVQDAMVDCPDEIEVDPATTVKCPVTGASGVGSVSFDFSDAAGSIDESSVDTEG